MPTNHHLESMLGDGAYITALLNVASIDYPFYAWLSGFTCEDKSKLLDHFDRTIEVEYHDPYLNALNHALFGHSSMTNKWCLFAN